MAEEYTHAKYTNKLSAEGLVSYIAHAYIELSYEKVQWEYLHHIRLCKEWLRSRPKEPPEPEQYLLPFYGPDNLDF